MILNETEKEKVSVIVPCYNEMEAIPFFYAEFIKCISEIKNYEFEVLFVDDGSKDDTLNVIKELSLKDERIHFLALSKNFGKESAMYAGLCNASGDYAVIMDADLQDPPSILPEMLEKINEGYDSVATRRVTRAGEPKLRSFFARLFYKLINRLSDTDIVDGARDYRLMKKDMVDAIVAMSEVNRFTKGIFGWVGFKTYWMEFDNQERVAGNTKWNFWGLFKYAMEGIVNFSETPLSIASWLGIFMTMVSFLAVIFIVVRKLIFGDPVAGWASTASIITFIGGLQLLCLGIIGKYISKMYLEVKRRPHFIIASSDRKDVTRIK